MSENARRAKRKKWWMVEKPEEPKAGMPSRPSWTVRAGPDGNLVVWLDGGCIDSIAELDEAEKLLRCVRPLLEDRQGTEPSPTPSEG